MKYGFAWLMWTVFLFPCLAGNAAGQVIEENKHQSFPDIQINGLRSYSADQIRNAIRFEPYVQLAAHPLASRQKLLSAVTEQLTAGFRRQGFLDASIKTEYDKAGNLAVMIDEGEKYFNGEIEIKNAKSIDADALRQRLKSKFPPTDASTFIIKGDGPKKEKVWVDENGKRLELTGPVWAADVASVMAPEYREFLKQQIVIALADLGYHHKNRFG